MFISENVVVLLSEFLRKNTLISNCFLKLRSIRNGILLSIDNYEILKTITLKGGKSNSVE
jgi:hypothetical protein